MNTFLPLCKTVAAGLGRAGRSLAVLAALGLPALAQAQTTVAFPRNASFTGTSTSGFTLGGNAFLTTTGSSATNGTVSGTPIDADGSGTLRLTNATSSPQQAGYAIDNSTFDTPNGFSISFEFFAYGTNTITPADGFSVFLVDGAGTTPGSGFAIGGFGGSLGYAPRTQNTTVEPGVTKGYLGIGIDEFGNFGIPSEGKTGGYPGTTTATLKNAVSLRGPYNSSDATYKTGYAYLAGSNTLPFNLAVGTSSTNQGSRVTTPTDGGYRKAYINVIPVITNGNVSYKITVRIQNGQNVATAVNNVTVVNPPSTLRVGFAASTGGSNSIHEIRGLTVVQAPIAVDDNAQTRYDQPITIGVLNNDLNGGGAAIAPATVDLNPNTVARDSSYTVTGRGTFKVDRQGVVTFTPSGTFSGTVSIPYTVLNLNQDLSNPGTITVIVTGADVQTGVSGPAAVNPGTMTAYTVTTTNNGQETATNVMPTLRLPAGFTVTQLPAGATQSTSGGFTTITFAQTTLTAQQSVTNSVRVQAPGTTGSNALTASYAYPSGAVVPDAVSANNSSTLTVNVRGAANIAGVCAVPGQNGPVTLSAGDTPNTYYPGVTATQGSQTITVGTTPTGNTATPIAAGDMLLIMQMQGATMSTANDSTYGKVSAATAGTYEYAVATSSVSTGGSLTLAGKLTKTYTANAASGNTFQVIRIPQYSALTVSGAATGTAWNGSTGGVLALEVAGATTFNSGASLNMNSKGFRGGVGKSFTGGTGLATTYFAKTADAAPYASKGEGIAGTPAGLTGTAPSYDDYAGGSYSIGHPATAGGGGLGNTTDRSGGGGGANGGNGGAGQTNGNSTGAAAGVASPAPSSTQLYLGSGGGASMTTLNGGAVANTNGGTGGGIIFLRSGSIGNAGTISANGANAINNVSYSGGGGGAGGTVVLRSNASLSNLTVTANGGNGGFSTNSGYGGAGGGGVCFSSNLVGSSTTNGGSVTDPANGTIVAAGAGAPGITNTATPIGADCQPALTTGLRTTTPNVTRSNSMSATYVYTVANTGGGITGLTASPSLAAVNGAANLFKYASMTSAVVQRTDGTTQTLATTDYTVTNTGTSTPTFTLTPAYVVPSGASVAFTFVASVDNAAVTSTAYGSNAAGTYLDPQRAVATTTAATPAYTSGTTSNADKVTIVTPLPVQLTKFTAVAVGADALLNWTTAQEVNNHHFEVERSLDGHTFAGIGTVAGRGTTTLTSGYAFTDAGANTHTTGVLYYRLRQVDYDGQASFSPVQTVRFRYAAGASNVTLYPNPTTSSATLDLSALPAGDYTVQVLETTGRLVLSGTYQPGKQTLPLDGLATGTYFVKVQGASFNLVLPLSKQ